MVGLQPKKRGAVDRVIGVGLLPSGDSVKWTYLKILVEKLPLLKVVKKRGHMGRGAIKNVPINGT